MESNRVDVGLFVHNGIHYSPPAFITWFSLDNEYRLYDDKGRIVEMGYGMGENRFNVKNWRGLFEKVQADPEAKKILALPDALANVLTETLRDWIEKEKAQKDLLAQQKDLLDRKKKLETE